VPPTSDEERIVFAVIVRVQLPEGRTIEEGRRQLESEVIPQVKQNPGFVAGYWLAPASGNEGLSVVVFQDEQSARTAAANVTPPEPVKLINTEVREVAASA
jgi:hypothetical protein